MLAQLELGTTVMFVNLVESQFVTQSELPQEIAKKKLTATLV
jgi:hypothetical protein